MTLKKKDKKRLKELREKHKDVAENEHLKNLLKEPETTSKGKPTKKIRKRTKKELAKIARILWVKLD